METYNYGRQMDVERGVNYVQVKLSRRDGPKGNLLLRSSDECGTGGGGVCTGRSRPARCDCRRVPMETYNYGRQMDVEKGG